MAANTKRNGRAQEKFEKKKTGERSNETSFSSHIFLSFGV
jgi:hypothetical protein